jgi:hypothetical protein
MEPRNIRVWREQRMSQRLVQGYRLGADRRNRQYLAGDALARLSFGLRRSRRARSLHACGALPNARQETDVPTAGTRARSSFGCRSLEHLPSHSEHSGLPLSPALGATQVRRR